VTSGNQPKIESTFEASWAAFQRLDSLRLVADTLEARWTQGRAQYLTFLVRIEDAAAQRYIAGLQEHLAGIPGVETYPGYYLHMTVKGGGFQVIKKTLDDDVLREDVPRIAAQAKQVLAGQRAFEARLGVAAGFPEVVFVEVHDGGRLRELNTLLAERLERVPRYPIDGGVFLPHVSIARFTSNDGLPRLKETLASMRDGPGGPSFVVRQIEFVKAWLSESTPEFQTLAPYPLTAPAGG
jgi:2'-5' RNA ligase